MAISDTFASLPALPLAVQLDLCAAALVERSEALQCAAVEALLAAGGDDHLAIVVDRFGSLLPAAVELVCCRQAGLVELARARVRADLLRDRLSAFRLLATVGGEECLEVLSGGMGDRSQEVRGVVFDAIEDRLRAWVVTPAARPVADDGRWRVVEAMLQAWPAHGRRSFVAQLGELGAAAVPVLRRASTAAGDAVPAVAIAAGFAGTSSRPCAELAIALVTEDHEATRAVGTYLLGARRDEAFAAELAACLVAVGRAARAVIPASARATLFEAAASVRDADAALRVLELAATELGDATLAQQVFQRFLCNPTARVQIAALRRLARLGFPAGHTVLGGVLAAAPDEVRRVAASIVLDLRLPDGATLLTPLLGAQDPELRQLARRGVSSNCLSRLLDSFEGMDSHVREVAARAVSKIDPQFGERLGQELCSLAPSRRLAALRVAELLHVDGALREPLLQLLDDPDLRVRATAIRMVEVTASVEGMKVLIDALCFPERRVRANAIEAIEQLADPRLVELIRPFLRDPDNRVRANAAKAMYELGADEGREVLCAMLVHDEEMMRISAAWALGELRFSGARELLETRERVETNQHVLARVREVLADFGVTETEIR